MTFRKITDPVLIDDAIDAWHEGEGNGMQLHEWLGWTWEEYSDYVTHAKLPAPAGEELPR